MGIGQIGTLVASRLAKAINTLSSRDRGGWLGGDGPLGAGFILLPQSDSPEAARCSRSIDRGAACLESRKLGRQANNFW